MFVQASSIFGTKFVLLFFTLASSIVTSRFLGVEARGHYFFLISVTALLIQFLNLGFQSSIVFYISKKPTVAAKMYQAILCYILLVSLLAIACLGVAFTLGTSFGIAVGLIALITLPALHFLFATNILLAQQRFKDFNVLEIFSRIASFLGIVVAAIIGFSHNGYLLMLGVANVLILVVIHFKYMSLPWDDSFKLKHSLKWAPYGFKIYFASLFGFLALKLNIFFANHYLSDTELGLLSISSQLSDIILFLPISIATVLFPKLSSGESFSLKKLSMIVFASMILMWCGVVFVGEFLISLVFGSDFAGANEMLSQFFPALITYSLLSVLSQFFVTKISTWYLSAIWAIGAAIVFTLSAWQGADYTIVSGAVALTVGYAFVYLAMLSLYISRASLGVDLK